MDDDKDNGNGFGGGFGDGYGDIATIDVTASGNVSATAGGSNANALGGGFSNGGNDTGLAGPDGYGTGQSLASALGISAQMQAGAMSGLLDSGVNALSAMATDALKNADWNVSSFLARFNVYSDVVMLDRSNGQFSAPVGPNSIVIEMWGQTNASSGDH